MIEIIVEDKEGFLRQCQPVPPGIFKCGKCGRGNITRNHKECLVCHSKVIVREIPDRPIEYTNGDAKNITSPTTPF